MAVTKQDIANFLGISRTAVSLALNNSPNSTLSQETHRKIVETAKLMGYSLKPVGNVCKKLCMALFNINSAAAMATNSASISYIDRYISDKGYSLVYLNILPKEDSLRRFYDFVESGEADGLILFSLLDSSVLQRVKEARTPYVVFSEMGDNPHNCFHADAEYVAETAVRRLADLGHRRIAFFSASLQFPQQRSLLRGYRNALRELGIGFDPSLVQPGSSENGAELAERMEQLDIPYTAAFCANPYIQFGALNWLKEHGVSVPEEKSLLGYGTNEIVNISIPKLSIYNVNKHIDLLSGMDFLMESIACGSRDQPGVRVRDIILSEGGTLAPSPQGR